jgi:signal transduction histidine kinase
MFLPVLSSLYAAWYLGSLIRATAVLVAAVASVVAAVTYLAPEAGINWVPWTTAILFIFMMGLTLRQQRLLIDQLNEAREALSRQAVADERRRIARELHDLAGHTLAAMLLHVTGARHVLGRDPGEARRALVDAETVGRASLDQIRATVAALRTDERGTDRALAGSADLGDLVEAYRRAGLAVELHLDGPVDRLDGPLGTALHRITQEALTNVARHAPGNEVVVAVAAGPAEVRLTVTDQGRAPTPATTTDGGPHFGLVGMRERARALGGDLEAGPHQDGWRVASILPLVGGPVDRGAMG